MATRNTKRLTELARAVRYHILQSTTTAGSGHPTSSSSAADIMTTLFFSELKADSKNPLNPKNDRVVFSKGHAAPLLYALYTVAGVISPKENKTLRKLNSRLEGHPTPEFAYVEAATGSLGQGLSVGVGLSLANKLNKSNARTFVLLGDGEVAEGSVWEAAAVGAQHKLGNLIAIVDVNRLAQSDPAMHGHNVKIYAGKFKAFGWKTIVVDGHDIEACKKAFSAFAKSTDAKPKVIIAKTIKGKGYSVAENKMDYHGKAFSKEVATQLLKELGDVDPKDTEEIKTVTSKKLDKTSVRVPAYSTFAIGSSVATRKAYGSGLVALGKINPQIVSLDGDTKNSTYAEVFKDAYPKRFFEMYIAEQNMVGTALGLSRLGYVPFVSTFSAFFTRAYDQIRMAALSEGNVKLVGSHAGVSIGEDGASQMGLEDLSMMRAVHNSTVLYPSDPVATERLLTAAAKQPGVVYVRTTRMATPVLYKTSETFVVGGSKVVRQSAKDHITLVGAGVTLHESLKAADMLAKKKIHARVIDLYSIKPVDEKTLKQAARSTQGIIVTEDHWFEGGMGDAVLNVFADGKISVPITKLAVTTTPHSATPEQLLKRHKIDADSIVKAALQLLKK